MADFRETLEVSKNSTCFLSYSFCKTKEDIAVDDQPEVDWSDNATLGEVADLIENFCETADKCQAAIECLFNTGRIKLEDEY